MLEGMKVVEMASINAGPTATAMLAEWGAEVIKVEPLDGDRGRQIMARLGVPSLEEEFDLHNRGKRGIAVDLHKPEARRIVETLVARADVFVTNILSEKQAERGLDWAHLSKINSRLIHASVSGYGSTGPDSQARSVDHTAFWARSGMAHLMTVKGQEPVPLRRALGDRVTATALCAGILAAYIEMQRTGRGKVVETSLLRSAMFAIGGDITMQLGTGRVGSNQARKTNANPYYSFFPTKDGRWVAVNIGGTEQLDVLDHPEIMDDPRFATAASRRQHAVEVIDVLDAIFRERTLDEWRVRLQPARFTWAPVQRPEESLTDPQVLAAGALVDVPRRNGEGTFRAQAMPVGFFSEDGTPDGLPTMQSPELGGHTDEILAEIGYGPERIAALRAEGVVR